LTVIASAMPASNPGNVSAAALRNIAFSTPPRDGLASARREASAIASGTASMPMTKAAGLARASARTNRPSPVPMSISS
jgi:hypothetical protein